MARTQREEKVIAEIHEWENKLYRYEPNDFELTYEKYIEQAFSLLPEGIQEPFFETLDTWLFHLHALLQGSQLQNEARERILTAGRALSPSVESIADMRELSIAQLQYISTQQIGRHRLYSFLQGGSAGAGSTHMLGADIPAMAVINLRAIQLTAMTYGIEVNTPFEMMSSLKVFHAATLPSRLKGQAWDELMQELHNQEDSYFFEGEEKLTNITWMEQPLKQMLKATAILLFRKKTIKGLPLIGIAIGASSNYRLTKGVTEFAEKYYQVRYLHNKGAFYDE